MTRHNTRSSRAVATRTLLAASLFILAACQQAERETPSGPTELDWARAALERNPQIEVIAADSDARVFTIRDTQSGEVHAVKLDELAAIPSSQLTAKTTSTQPDTMQEPMPATSAEPAARSAPQTTDESDTQPSIAAAPASTSEQPGEQAGEQAGSYTIERTDGQVRVSGPGVSIVSSGGTPASDPARMSNNAVEPIVCEGRRMVHLDNRRIYVDGDAIVVRGGCEMFITNSRIAASGTGVVVQDGTVHISNSEIEGAQSSIDAGSEAKLFVRGSTFRGVSRRAPEATVQDQGGNRWR